MCGIVGGFVKSHNIEDRAKVSRVLEASLDRGSDALGLWADNGKSSTPEEVVVKKFVVQFPKDDIPTNLGITFPVRPFTFMACLRGEPTTEWHGNTTEQDIQPFTVGDWTIVHNGTISNDTELRHECLATSDMNVPTKVDSWTIAYVLDKYGWKYGLEMLVGSFAILAYNAKEKDRMYWACNYKPLYILGQPYDDFFIFASQKEYLNSIAQNPMVRPSPIQLGPYESGFITKNGHLHRDTLLSVRRPNMRTLVVCSGGLDSSVAAWVAAKSGAEVTLLHFQYFARAQDPEWEACINLARNLKCDIVTVPIDFFQAHTYSPLTDPDAPIAQGVSGARFAHEWVPARNTVMFALALAYAEAHDYTSIVYGGNQEESCGGYPDNEQEFVNKWNDLVPFAVKPYTEVMFIDPLGGMMKHDIVTLGHISGAPMELSWSCYESGDRHCGRCGPCTMRRRAFKMADVEDLTAYEQKEMV